MSAEAMVGADRKAQALGVPGERLMEHAGTATAAAARALAIDTERWGHGPIVILAGPGNNGGDGFVAARHLARAGADVIVAFVASEGRPKGRDAAKNWDRLSARAARARSIHAPVARDVAILGQGIEKAAIVVDALLGTGVRGELREPIRTAVELVNRARAAMVPGPRGRHADRGRPLERPAVRPGRPGRPDDHLPPTEDRAADEDGRRARRPRPRRPDRDPARGRPWLSGPLGLRDVLVARRRAASSSCSARRS